MKTLKLVVFCLLTISGLKSYCQDPSFSQFYFNQTYFNPAFVGLHGGSNVNLTYRRLWVNMPGKFETMFFNFDSDISAINGLGGFGINAYRDVEGEGNLTTTGVDIMLSTRFPNNSSKRRTLNENFYIQPGIAVGLIHKDIDWNNLVFGDQLDAIYGNVRPSNFSHPADQENIFPDFKIGVVFKYGKGPKKNVFRGNWDVKFGFAAHHVFEPNQSFLGQESRLARKYVSHLNFNFALNHEADMIFAPCIVWESQAQMNTFIGGFNLLWKNVFIGSWLRTFKNYDALVFTLGFIQGSDMPYTDKFKMYYSYDLTVSGLSNRASGGSHEISLVYYFNKSLNAWLKLGRKKGSDKFKKIPCPTGF